MSGRYCIQCGQKLEADAAFCIACGAPVAPPAEQQVDFPASSHPVGTVSGYCEKTQRMDAQLAEGPIRGYGAGAALGGEPPVAARPIGSSAAGDAPRRKKGLSPLALGAVVFFAALVLIGGGALLFLFHPWDASMGSDDVRTATVQQPASEGSSTGEGQGTSSSSDGAVSKQGDADGKAKTSESDIKAALTVAYDKLSGYDEEIRACASNYNSAFVTAPLAARKASLAACTALRERIDASAAEAKAIDVPTSSSYYQKHQDINILYDDLSSRIGVIEESWAIDVRYENPADHVAEIEAPIVRDNDSDGKNKYLLDFQDRYPSARP